MSRELTRSKWVYIETEEEFLEMLKGVRVQIPSKFPGPGKYLHLSYSQPCPRGCCYDDVLEMIPAREVIDECKEIIEEHASILKVARNKQVEDYLMREYKERLAHKRELAEKVHKKKQEEARRKEELDRQLFEQLKEKYEGGK